MRFFLTFYLCPNDIQKDGDDSCIDQISEHRTDNRNDEERFDGIAVLITYGTHVRHRIGGGTKTEATHASTQHGSIIIATSQGEGYTVSKYCHHNHLGYQNDN